MDSGRELLPRIKDRVRDLVGGYNRVALVLQGGDAPGAYQTGVYHALSEVGCEPNLALGRVYRRDQRLDHRGQQARGSTGAIEGFLGSGLRP